MGFFKVTNFIFFVISLLMTMWVIMSMIDLYDMMKYGLTSLIYNIVLIVGGVLLSRKYFKRLNYSDKDYEKLASDFNDKYLK